MIESVTVAASAQGVPEAAAEGTVAGHGRKGEAAMRRMLWRALP